MKTQLFVRSLGNPFIFMISKITAGLSRFISARSVSNSARVISSRAKAVARIFTPACCCSEASTIADGCPVSQESHAKNTSARVSAGVAIPAEVAGAWSSIQVKAPMIAAYCDGVTGGEGWRVVEWLAKQERAA